MKTQNLKFIAIAFVFILASCSEKSKKTKEKAEVIAETKTAHEYAHGGWADLLKKKDVQ